MDGSPMGRGVSIGGNAPLELTSRDAVWLVAEGRVDLFLATGAREEWTRHYLATFDAGAWLCGTASGDPERALLAVGAGSAVVVEVDAAHMDVDEAAREFERWIRAMGRAIARHQPRPVLDEILGDTDGDWSLADGARAAAGKSLIAWVAVSAGAARLLGHQQLGSDSFPLSEDLWIESSGATTLNVSSTAAVIGRGAIWPALRAFQASVIACADFQRAATQRDELARAERQAATDRGIRSAALHEMAGVLEGVSPGESVRLPRSNVAAAVSIVAAEMGFSIDDDEASDGPVGNVLAEIARNTDVRVRKVLLRDRWWRSDHGPLVAQIDSELRPIALVKRGGSYLANDVATGQVLSVDRAVAARVSPHAYSLYRPLPNRSLKMRDLFRFGSFAAARDYWRLAMVTIAWSLAGLIPAVIAGTIFDSVVPGRDVALLVQFTIVLLAVALASAMFDVARKLMYLRLETRIGISIQAAVWDRLLKLPVPFFRRFSAGELAMRANAIDDVRRTMTGVLVSGIVGAVFAAFTLALLFWYSPALAIWATLLGAISALVTVGAGVAKLRFQSRAVELQAKLAGLVLQMLTGIAKIRVAGAEDRAFAVWAASFAGQKHSGARAARVDAGLKSFNAIFSMVATVVIFGLFLNVVGRAGGLSLGDFVAFQYAFATFLGTIVQMSLSALQAIALVPLVRNARPIFEAMPDSSSMEGTPVSVGDTIDVSHVSFGYDEGAKPVLDDVSIHAASREFVALVGPSGAGKSTVFRLLLGFESPRSGAIYYDGRNLANLDRQKVRRNIGVVLQNGRFMAGDIFTNIVGSSPLTLDEAWDAARMAGLADDIRRMPMGMHTVLPEGASTLSGGQRQRLMIARALARQPRLLLLDEATSALDNRTQEVINASLSRLNVTRIVIAHRLSTVRNADRVYVMMDGRIAESGSCDDLMRNDGPFARLARRQSLEETQERS